MAILTVFIISISMIEFINVPIIKLIIMKNYTKAITGGMLAIVVFAGVAASTAQYALADVTISFPNSVLWNNDRTNDDVLQLSSLKITSIQSSGGSLPAVVTASTDSGFDCRKYNNEKSDLHGPCPLPKMADRVYNIRVSTGTILLFSNRTQSTFADFAVGDRINVFGFRDNSTNGIDALIMRNLSKPSIARWVQVSGVKVTAISGTVLPATITISKNGSTENVTVSANTVLLYRGRSTAPFSAFVVGDTVNVWGLEKDNVITAYIVRNIDKPAKTTGTVSITSLTGPTSLKVGQNGTWSITATNQSSGNLSYAVRYGDEVVYVSGTAANFRAPNNDSTAGFTHSYTNPGTYTLTFTVTNASGNTATGTLTVNVTN